MRKFIYLLGLISVSAFAQKQQKDVITVSANYTFSEPTQYGVSLEFNKGIKTDERLTSWILNAGYGQLELNENHLKTTGQGFVVRSEERRVGKECRSRRWRSHQKKERPSCCKSRD